jgi:acetyl esterase/lipase
LLGASAGAHLAALVALAWDRAPLFGAYPADSYAALRPKFCSLIAAYGIYDLFAHWQDTRSNNAAAGEDITERFLGCSPFDDPQLYTFASPLRHISYRHNALKVFLTWGTHDTAVNPRQSEAFRLALEQARFFVRTCPVVGAGHFWFSEDPIDDPQGFTAAVGPRIVRFLERVGEAWRPSE